MGQTDCVYKCNGVCFGDVACNRTTEKCDTGCNIGYTGVMCDTGMMKLNIDLNRLLSLQGFFFGLKKINM